MKEELLPLKNPSGHKRTIQVDTCRLDKQTLQVRAELIDTRVDGYLIHQILVRLEVGIDLIITKAEFLTPKAPYKECSHYNVPADRLIGLSAGKGFTKKVMDIYGGVEGCSHIVTILMTLAPAIRQGLAFVMVFPGEEQVLTERNLNATVQNMASYLTDSCMVWKKDSPVQQDIAKGIVRDLPERIYPNFEKKRGKPK
jgi:Protein of unknown function (DUF2889)